MSVEQRAAGRLIRHFTNMKIGNFSEECLPPTGDLLSVPRDLPPRDVLKIFSIITSGILAPFQTPLSSVRRTKIMIGSLPGKYPNLCYPGYVIMADNEGGAAEGNQW